MAHTSAQEIKDSIHVYQFANVQSLLTEGSIKMECDSRPALLTRRIKWSGGNLLSLTLSWYMYSIMCLLISMSK